MSVGGRYIHTHTHTHTCNAPLLLEDIVGPVAQQPLQLLLAHAVGGGRGRSGGGGGGGGGLDGLEDGVVLCLCCCSRDGRVSGRGRALPAWRGVGGVEATRFCVSGGGGGGEEVGEHKEL